MRKVTSCLIFNCKITFKLSTSLDILASILNGSELFYLQLFITCPSRLKLLRLLLLENSDSSEERFSSGTYNFSVISGLDLSMKSNTAHIC